MTRIEIDGSDLVVHVLGWDKVWALRGSLRFPLTSIVSYGPGGGESENRPWLRLAGTAVPGFLAGTFSGKDGMSFWDVRDFADAISIHLRDNGYEKVVVQVEDVGATLGLIARALP
jgi:hypothetical protein